MLDRAGREKRRKKQAIKRMEQIIKIHTEEAGEEEPEEEEREDRRGGERREERQRRQHKRSILKQGEGRRGEPPMLESVRGKGGKEAKVKFAGSLRKTGRTDRRRVMVRSPAYMLQLPWGYGPVQHTSNGQHLYELQMLPRL